ncbi:TlpA family protein disulfide reductase, partial [Enterococcus faecium]|nr:TlpA family protein disulfide reductase [Enterococcus faecium]
SGMATLFLTKIIRCCECCGVMATIALDNEHPRI